MKVMGFYAFYCYCDSCKFITSNHEMRPKDNDPLDVVVTTYSEYKPHSNLDIVKQFDITMELIRNSGETEMDKRREENKLKELNSKKVSRESNAYIRNWKNQWKRYIIKNLNYSLD